ncbi:helix-turn-helix transcriptional regulator [Streptomyces sp. NPDC020755]|uniref:helix-turn-helix transcriptional regulator n=1 Tax=Streptomyces sp. NPDC020755 TaxID=3154790 RepID=UPI0033DF24C3
MPHHDHPPWVREERRRLGARIRERRMRQNLTQEELAHRAGVSRDTVQRIEYATNNPRLTDLLRVARALETKLADLLEERLAGPGSGPSAGDSAE